jgi:Tfp pilus assembly protein PilF
LQHALALEYIKIGEDGEARKLFESILDRDAAYIGTYYHLAKLLERTGHNEEAIQWYEKGMTAAKQAGTSIATMNYRLLMRIWYIKLCETSHSFQFHRVA